MIQEQTVRDLAQAYLEGGTGFVVDVRVREGNVIGILLDDDEGTSISKCI